MKYPLYIWIALFMFLAQPGEAKKIKNSFAIEKEARTNKKKPTPSLKGRNIVLKDTTVNNDLKTSMANIGFSGYDKEINSSQESFLVTNPTLYTLTGFEIKIEYYDMKDRLLHSKIVKESCEIPPHESRRFDIKSWDTQHTYYYYLGNEPKKVATPYKVSFKPLSFWINEEE